MRRSFAALSFHIATDTLAIMGAAKAPWTGRFKVAPPRRTAVIALPNGVEVTATEIRDGDTAHHGDLVAIAADGTRFAFKPPATPLAQGTNVALEGIAERLDEVNPALEGREVVVHIEGKRLVDVSKIAFDVTMAVDLAKEGGDSVVLVDRRTGRIVPPREATPDAVALEDVGGGLIDHPHALAEGAGEAKGAV